MPKENVLTQSLEDYLETILLLEKKQRVARVKDIARELNIQMPSVTGALKTLKSRDLVDYEKNSFITLTQKGKMMAQVILRKHNIIKAFFTNILLLDEEKSTEEACKMEHTIDIETAVRLERCGNYIKENLKSDQNWNNIITGE